MARFTHHWTDTDFRVFAAPKGSHQIVVGANGENGELGDEGAPGTRHVIPGSGGSGGSGDSGSDATADGSKLKFTHANPLGTWLESAAGGHGGNGGDGGDAGTFPKHHDDYGSSWPGGGNGGNGGIGGNAIASIVSRNIYGRTGTADNDGIHLTVNATGGAGGRGGDGGNGDGENNSPYAGGNGGTAGFGGAGGDVFAYIDQATFARANNASNHFVMSIELNATGGDGAHGGDGGKGGLGTPAGADGAGGSGGNAGEGATQVSNTTFDLSHGGSGTSLLTVIMTSHGGDGGDGGEAGGPAGATGGPGTGGSAGITFFSNLIQGGAEDDAVRLGFTSIAGEGGVSGDGSEHAVNGGGGAELNACDFQGGGGHNTLLFSWTGGNTNLPVTVDLNASTVGMGGGVCTINGFLDITGGSAGDFITGNDGKNVINGADGGDELRGMANADTLTGGAGHDSFIFIAADESSGPTYDTITDLNFNQDNIGVDFDVAHIDAAIGGATISKASFDADIAGAVGDLKSHHAVVVTAKHGTLHDHTFLVIEGEGVKGYQPGHHIVIDVTGLTGTMTLGDFFNAH